jgi:dUTP pyrophosphatase
MLVFERIHADAIVPTKGTLRAACYDLYTVEEGCTRFGSVSIFSTGIRMAIPDGYMGHIVPRSGLARYNGIQVMGGIIDSDYRGEIKVMLTSVINNDTHHVKKGDRIAQLLIIQNPLLMVREGKVNNDTERGTGGFGSTDKPTPTQYGFDVRE